MPNEESPVDMEVTIEAEDLSEIVDQKDIDNGAATVSVEVVAEELKNLGNAEYSKKDYRKAIEFYTQAIDTFPTAAYYGNRAAAFVMLAQFDRALEDARRSTSIDPTFTKGYLREAKCQLALGEFVAAIHLYEKILEKDATNAVALDEHKQAKLVQGLLHRCDVSYQKEDFRTMIFHLDRCIEICPHCLKFKTLKAECLVFLKRYEEAQNITSDVLRLDGINADAIYIRGLCLYYTDSYDKAFQHFRQVLTVAPDHSKAKEAYKKAKTLKTKKEEGNAAYTRGKYEEAERIYKEALEVDKLNIISNSKLHYNLATVNSKMKKYNEAISHCTHAIKLDNKYTKAYMKRAHCYSELEKFEEAVREYETILKFDKSREIRSAYEKAKLNLKKSKRKDYYKLLGLNKNATEDEIKKGYRKHALLHHPDRHSNATDEVKKQEEQKFKEVGEAYAVLSDAKKKSLYDSGHDLEEINNGGHAGFNGNFDENLVFQTFFGGARGGGGFPGGFSQGGGFPGGFSNFNFQF